MTYQQELEAMSDSELNILLAKLQYPEFVIYVQNDTIRVQDPEGDDFYVQYCNNPNDTMLLAFDAGMDFILNMDIYKYKCLASTFDCMGNFENDFEATHENPLRAAVIILLLIDKENEK